MLTTLTIYDKEYPLLFGMGFMRKIDKTVQVPITGAPGVKQNAGLRFKLAALFEGDFEALEDILLAASAEADPHKRPELTREILDKYIEDEETDVEDLLQQVRDFLRRANVTKSIAKQLDEMTVEDTNKSE